MHFALLPITVNIQVALKKSNQNALGMKKGFGGSG